MGASLLLPTVAWSAVATQPIGPACADAPQGRFTDVSGAHQPGIDCIGWWGVTQGTGGGYYDPSDPVDRGQMAAFVARTIELSGGQLPGDAPSGFGDTVGNVHAVAIDQLAAIGVVGGTARGIYDPAGTVTRAQMGSFLARAWKARTGASLDVDDRVSFPDVAGNVHESNISRIASAGLTGGLSDGSYEPTGTVTRAQMGTFLARFLAALVEQDSAPYPPADPVPMPEPPAVPACAGVGSAEDAARCLYAATAAGERAVALRVASDAAVNEFQAASSYEGFETWEFTGCGEPILLGPLDGLSCTFYEPPIDWVHGVVIELRMGTRDGAPFIEDVGYVG